MKYLVKGARVIDPQINLDDVCDVLIDNGFIAKVEKSISEKDFIVEGDAEANVEVILSLIHI